LAKEQATTKPVLNDPLLDQYNKASDWVKPRTKTIFTALAAIAALLILFWIYQAFSRSNVEKAGNAFNEALKIDNAPVGDPLPQVEAGQPAFTNEEEKNKKAIEAFEKVSREHSSMYGDIAGFYAAVRQLNVDGAKGEAALKVLADKNSTVSTQARLALAERYEATNKLDDALGLYAKLKANPGEISPSLIEFNTARIYEAQGKKQEAADLYFKLAGENREKPTSVNTKALSQLSLLDPARVDKLPEAEKKDSSGLMIK
jgi:hypothetical protein